MQIRKTRLGSVFLGLVFSPFLASCLNTGNLSNISSCSALGPCTSSSGSGAGGGTTAETSPTSPFKLSLTSYWYGDTGKLKPTSHPLMKMTGNTVDTVTTDSCEIPEGTPAAAPNNTAGDLANAIQTCGVKIPETQLALSSLEFKVEAPANHSCDVVYFYPYFYLVSTSASFLPPWLSTAVNCATLTNGSRDKQCYTGPAVDLIPGFPKTVGEINPIKDKTVKYQQSWTAKSSLEAYSQAFDTSNKFTSFNPLSFTIDSQVALTQVRKPYTWTFTCVQKGSSRMYDYTLRIFPEKDSDFYPGAPRKYGWTYDNGSLIIDSHEQ